jgi:hypothetical protein
MKLIKFFRRIFKRDKKHIDFYSEAIAEGIKDAFKELGSSMGLDDRS